jgi:hypothetical protein
LIEELLALDEPPGVLTFSVEFSAGDTVQYFGETLSPDGTSLKGAQDLSSGDRGKVIDVNPYNGDVVVAWETNGTLVHDYSAGELRPLLSGLDES